MPHPPNRSSIGRDFLLVGPEQRVETMFVGLLEEPNIFDSLPLQVGSHACHAQSQLSRSLEIVTEKVVEDLHVSLLLEENMVGQVLQYLYNVNLVIIKGSYSMGQ